MVVIKNIKTNKGKEKNKVSFEKFNNKSLERTWKVSSILLKLKDIEEFDKNVRQNYDIEDMEDLKKSIKSRSDIWNIDVYHITKWDRYVISDWHRTYRAYKELYWNDYKVEVVVRREVPELTPEVELNLMEVWFVTSNTKKNLSFYEMINSIFKYTSQLDKIDPSNAPHKVSQVMVYEALWLSKSKAMAYNKLLNKFTLSDLSIFEKTEVSYKLLMEMSKVDDKKELEDIVYFIKEWKITNTWDLKKYQDIKSDIEINSQLDESNNDLNNSNGDDLSDSQEENRKKVMDKFEAPEKTSWRDEYKSVNSIKNSSKKFYKELLNLNVDNLNDEERDILNESIDNIKRILKDKKL